MIIEVSKGLQISLPANIRKKYNISKGTKLELEDTGKEMKIRPISEDSWEDLFKEGKKYKCDLSIEELNELFYREIHGR